MNISYISKGVWLKKKKFQHISGTTLLVLYTNVRDKNAVALENKALREREHPSAHRSVNELLGQTICHAPWPKVNPIVHPTSYPTRIPFIPSESTLPFQRYNNFHILPWKSKIKFIGEVKRWSHNVSLTSYRLTSILFHVNAPCAPPPQPPSMTIGHSIPEIQLNFKFDLENTRSRSWRKSKLEVTKWGVASHRLTFLFVLCQSTRPFLRNKIF